MIFVKLRQMSAYDRSAVRAFAQDRQWAATQTPGHTRAVLHTAQTETVCLEQLRPGCVLPMRYNVGGTEILVLSGSARLRSHGETDGASDAPLETFSWWRNPTATQVSVATETGALLWVKTGHLRA